MNIQYDFIILSLLCAPNWLKVRTNGLKNHFLKLRKSANSWGDLSRRTMKILISASDGSSP